MDYQYNSLANKGACCSCQWQKYQKAHDPLNEPLTNNLIGGTDTCRKPNYFNPVGYYSGMHSKMAPIATPCHQFRMKPGVCGDVYNGWVGGLNPAEQSSLQQCIRDTRGDVMGCIKLFRDEFKPQGEY